MPEEQKTEPGMDVFDFLYELWRAKWLFLGVLATTVVVGLAPLLSAASAVDSGRFIAHYQFTVGAGSDPLVRSTGNLVEDLVLYFDPGRALDLVEVGRNPGGKQSPRMFVATVDPAGHRGTFTVTATDGEPAFFRAVHDELQRAAVAQVDATRARVDRELELLQTVAREYGGGNTEFSASRAFAMLRFLDDLRLDAGEFRLVVFEPFNTVAVEREIGNLDIAKRLVTFALLGCVLGVLAIMFRIAIRRKRVGAARPDVA